MTFLYQSFKLPNVTSGSLQKGLGNLKKEKMKSYQRNTKKSKNKNAEDMLDPTVQENQTLRY